MEFFKIIVCIAWTVWVANIVDYIIKSWYNIPLKEEKSIPIYITKNIE